MVWSLLGSRDKACQVTWLSVSLLLRVPLLPLLDPDPLALGRWTVVLLVVPVIVLMEVARVSGEVWLELPLLTVGQLQHVGYLNHLRLHEDVVGTLAVAVDEVEVGLAGHRESNAPKLSANFHAQLERPVGEGGRGW